MKILVLGSKGQIGCCLVDQLSKTDYDVIYTSRSEIDIADMAGTKASITNLRPNLIINATGYTAVDKAEDDCYEAEKINHFAIANIANTCSEIGCWLVHISTDYVFDGLSNHPYVENAKTNPKSIYGTSKLNGELAIKTSGCQYLIIRTAWVYSEYGNNFLKTMLKLGTDHDEICVVGDQIGCPTYAQDIAETIVSIVFKLNLNSTNSGTFHYCGDNACSWHQFAQSIFLEAKKYGWKTPNYINSIVTAKYNTRAVRPFYSAMSCSKIYNTFEIIPSNWRKGIKYVLKKLNKEIIN